jgi:hypothetical protein
MCLKFCQLTNHRSIVSHIYATNLVVVRRGVFRQHQDPPRDRLSQGPSRVSVSEICEQPIPFVDQCVYNIDLGTHLPDKSQADDKSLACAKARWSQANITHTLSSRSSKALRNRPFWFGRNRVGFRSPRPHSGLIQHWRLEPDSIRVLSRIATPLEATSCKHPSYPNEDCPLH